MAPFHLPWLTFGAFLVLGFTIVLALVWAYLDLRNEKKQEERGS